MSIITIIIIVVAVAILWKSGSLGKAIGFVLSVGLYPIIFGTIGFLVGLKLGSSTFGLLVGLGLGFFLIYRNGRNKLR